jgi:hypothetical protein
VSVSYDLVGCAAKESPPDARIEAISLMGGSRFKRRERASSLLSNMLQAVAASGKN